MLFIFTSVIYARFKNILISYIHGLQKTGYLSMCRKQINLIFVNRCVKTYIIVITQLLVVLIYAKLTWEIHISLVKSKLSVETSVVSLCTEPAVIDKTGVFYTNLFLPFIMF